MKAKAIEKLLKAQIEKARHYVNKAQFEAIQRGFVAGGCIPSMMQGEFVSDYDIYLRSEDDVRLFTANPLKDFRNPVYYVLTENALTLKEVKIQIILKYFGESWNVVPKFDFAHIKSYYDMKTGKLYVNSDTYRLITEKELIYTGSEFPLSSLLRVRKYLKKGWDIDATNMIRIVGDIMNVFAEPKKILRPYDTEKDTASNEPGFDYVKVPVEINVEEFIRQLNGVDPLTIRARLEKEMGKRLTFSEIINLIEDDI